LKIGAEHLEQLRREVLADGLDELDRPVRRVLATTDLKETYSKMEKSASLLVARLAEVVSNQGHE